MISIVTVTRTTTCKREVEHPSDWTAEQVAAAAANRTADLVDGVYSWEGSRTRVESVELDEALPEPEEDDSGWKPSMPEPVELVGGDL